MSVFHEASSPVNPRVITSVSGIVISDVPCDSTVFVGAAVRMDNTGVAYNASAASEATANVIGVVQSKSSSTLCDIRVTGVTTAIYTGLDVTKEYFLSASVDGELTTIPPASSGNIVLRVGQPYSGSRLLVNKGTGLKRD